MYQQRLLLGMGLHILGPNPTIKRHFQLHNHLWSNENVVKLLMVIVEYIFEDNRDYRSGYLSCTHSSISRKSPNLIMEMI